MSSHPGRGGAQLRAPELEGRGWHNTGGLPVSIRDLQGQVALLVFWRSGCVGCVRVFDDLQPVHESFAEALSVVAVHAPKFARHADPEFLPIAIERHGLAHPVLDDGDLATWTAYSVNTWPTLVAVDPEGYVVAHLAGESHSESLGSFVGQLVDQHRALGTLKARSGATAMAPPANGGSTRLRFPGKAIAMPDDRPLAVPEWSGGVLATDTLHGQLVVLGDDLYSEVGRIGTGESGLADGAPDVARFRHPQGMGLLPPQVASSVGYDVVVADPGSQSLRGLNLADGSVSTLAGTGTALRGRRGPPSPVPALSQPLGSPWDAAWFGGFIAVAMAGANQLWAFVPSPGEGGGSLVVLAGAGSEGLLDGPARHAWFAEPTGLAVGADGETLWIVDAQTSALRWLRHSPAGGYEVGTAIGQGLFEFGFRDGNRVEALLQAPTGLAGLADGSVAVADTLNGAVRRYDPLVGEVSTLASSLDGPTDVIDLHGALVVVESSAHRLRRVPGPGSDQKVRAAVQHSPRRAIEMAPGPVDIEVLFTPPTGHHLDETRDHGVWLTVIADPPGLLADGAGTTEGLRRRLVIGDVFDGEPDVGVLHVAAQAGVIAEGDGAAATSGPLFQQDWGIPIHVVTGGAKRISLDLRGIRPPRPSRGQ